jgi:hypothetical protein
MNISSIGTNIIPGTLMPIGAVKSTSPHGVTAAASPGSPSPGSGEALALYDGRTPGKVAADQIYEEIDPLILDLQSQTPGPGTLLDYQV